MSDKSAPLIFARYLPLTLIKEMFNVFNIFNLSLYLNNIAIHLTAVGQL